MWDIHKTLYDAGCAAGWAGTQVRFQRWHWSVVWQSPCLPWLERYRRGSLCDFEEQRVFTATALLIVSVEPTCITDWILCNWLLCLICVLITFTTVAALFVTLSLWKPGSDYRMMMSQNLPKASNLEFAVTGHRNLKFDLENLKTREGGPGLSTKRADACLLLHSLECRHTDKGLVTSVSLICGKLSMAHWHKYPLLSRICSPLPSMRSESFNCQTENTSHNVSHSKCIHFWKQY